MIALRVESRSIPNRNRDPTVLQGLAREFRRHNLALRSHVLYDGVRFLLADESGSGSVRGDPILVRLLVPHTDLLRQGASSQVRAVSRRLLGQCFGLVIELSLSVLLLLLLLL